ncbi:MAG: hypothetical protein E2586_03900 [Novosphingobium sp.]|uniref:phage tail protein n=1 Tax=Novosphingobium sp. TaxID=1874826 RepID=UPI0012CE677C|nr:phage tail protein [Novosphingobium sp.]MPS67622.1 hypothetical protein [Novosphingobium sp.]
MATLVFSTVGTALGGPVGGAIGSLVGSQFDAAIFGSPNRQGARLKELEVTTSSYGQPLPRHFGRMRVAGQMIWAAELTEHSETLGGGKGAPSVTTYSYSASFAVALSSRPILALGRIWADGRLLRGAEGDLKVGGTLRIHTGHGDQACDPLILAAEGEARCPAHRDLAYVVFEDLDLSEYYNHIPALTFEVIADERFDLSGVIGDLVEDIDAAVPLESFGGLSCDGSLADILRVIDQVEPLCTDAGRDRLVIARERLQTSPIALTEAAISAQDGDFGAATGFSRSRAAPGEQPLSVLRYFDRDRDYLPGVQHATGRAIAGEPRALELPAALDAATARSLIERIRRRIDWSRDRISWRTSELDCDVAPGASVTFPGLPGLWRVEAWEWRDSGIEISATRRVPTGADAPPRLATDPGRINPQPDLPPGQTALVALELPYDAATGTPDSARPIAALSSSTANWSGAALFADRGDGGLLPLGPSGRMRSIVGTASTALPPASALLFDRASTLEVRLTGADLQLASASLRQLAEGANLALVGDEIIQFAGALPLGGGTWWLTGFLRGRGGTETAIGTHLPGEPFVLLDRKAVALDPAIVGTGSERRIVAAGRGDPEPVAVPIRLEGITLRPLAPVHPRVTRLADGTLRAAWTRRARGNWTWQDGLDVPLVEQTESYLVTFGAIGSPLATWTLAAPSIDLAPDLVARLSAGAPGEWLRVRQQGTHALSEPLPVLSLN